MTAQMIKLLPGRLSMRRFFGGPLGVSTVLAIMVLAGLVAISWRTLDRLQPVQEHLVRIARIQDVGLMMEKNVVQGSSRRSDRSDRAKETQRRSVQDRRP